MSHNHITPTYPWYNPSRISTWGTTGEGEAVARMLIKNRPLIVASLYKVEFDQIAKGCVEECVEESEPKGVVDEPMVAGEPLEPTTLDVIETFLKCDNLRIVADESGAAGEVTIEVELEDIDDLVTEELAEIYIAQGLIDEGKAIYTKLSLLNSEKSVYFAELIENIDKNIGE